jgi:hypothetical protein
VSGEATARTTAGAVALERAFGARASCNACLESVEDYRVVALFLHDLAVVRAYCGVCYPAAAEGEYHAGGDGIVLDYASFATRFGAAGPPPPPATPVDRLLAGLIRDPALRWLSPPSEAFARKRRELPYRVRAEFSIAERTREARLALTPDGRLQSLDGDDDACARVRALTAKPSTRC